jgi:uncharacterized protein
MIKRSLQKIIEKKLGSQKAVIILGARQTGKTTLLKSIFEKLDEALWLNADEPDIQALFETSTSSRFKALFAGYSTIVLDEAQRIKDIGIKLKLIIDQIPELQLIATGSSAFELANQTNEPLTGRKWEFQLYPFAFEELIKHQNEIEEIRLLNHRLVFGTYPEVVTSVGNEKELLKQLSDSYLYKDILMWENIKKPEKLLKLMQALAYQLGNEVSYNELGQMLGLDNQTVEKYIQLLEKTFVIFRLGAFSRNLRKELKRSRKIYFFDNGIRNALIANFNLAELRSDIGALWENYLISERIKYLHHHQIWSNSWFWRTQDQQEIDYLEERDGKLYAWEFKWNPKAKARLSKTFAKAYPNHEFKVITPENYQQFLL